MQKISRSEARALKEAARERGDQTYYTGVPCKHGHDCGRYATNGNCVECQRTRFRSYKYEWRKEQRKNKKYVKRERAYDKQLRASNLDYRAKDTAVVRYNQIKNGHPHCIPAGFTREEIIEDTLPFYLGAAAITELTGEPYEVDHVEAVIHGGIHHSSNLKVITREENRRKAAKEIHALADANNGIVAVTA